MPNYAIIGGSDAGITAAFRIKELQPDAEVQLFLKDRYPNYSICGIPFFLSGEIDDWKNLAHRTREMITAAGIAIMDQTEIVSVDPKHKRISSTKDHYTYDKLLIATGATSIIPAIKGNTANGVFTLRWIDEMLAVDQYLRDNQCKKAVIIGGGYIGVEMADAFKKRGLAVTLIEPSTTVLKTLDISFGEKVQNELKENGVRVINGKRVVEIKEIATGLLVEGENELSVVADIILLVTGARPNTLFAESIGLELGKSNAYRTNQQMQSNIPGIYVAGDCAETYHHLLQDYVYQPLGTTSHKQGRIAGETMCGLDSSFSGSIGTQVVKVFDLVAGRTGFHDRDCERYGIPHTTVESEFWDHKHYYPGAEKLHIRITANPLDGTLLGMQIIGSTRSEISKRLDIAAVAIQNGLSVRQLNDLDLSYTPPLSSPWDPVQMAAQTWLKVTGDIAVHQKSQNALNS